MDSCVSQFIIDVLLEGVSFNQTHLQFGLEYLQLELGGLRLLGVQSISCLFRFGYFQRVSCYPFPFSYYGRARGRICILFFL